MKKIGFILILFVCLKGSLSWGQYFTDLYFPDVKFARQFEQVELSEFQKVVKKNKESFLKVFIWTNTGKKIHWRSLLQMQKMVDMVSREEPWIKNGRMRFL